MRKGLLFIKRSYFFLEEKKRKTKPKIQEEAAQIYFFKEIPVIIISGKYTHLN